MLIVIIYCVPGAILSFYMNYLFEYSQEPREKLRDLPKVIQVVNSRVWISLAYFTL